MWPHNLKKRLKPLTKSSRTKQSYRSSYTIPKRPLEERHGERTKAETNASQFKITFISKWKSSKNGGRSTSIGGWRKQRTLMVSSGGVANVQRSNARSIQTSSFT
jgi:hypothetical protein